MSMLCRSSNISDLFIYFFQSAQISRFDTFFFVSFIIFKFAVQFRTEKASRIKLSLKSSWKLKLELRTTLVSKCQYPIGFEPQTQVLDLLGSDFELRIELQRYIFLDQVQQTYDAASDTKKKVD